MESKLEEIRDSKTADQWMYVEMRKLDAKDKLMKDITIWLLCVLLFVSWGGFFWYNAQWDNTITTETITMETSDDGINAYNDGEGDVTIGENDNKKSNQE